MFNQPKVFSSYRRDDSAFQTTTLYGELSRHFGRRIVLVVCRAVVPGLDVDVSLNAPGLATRRFLEMQYE